MGTRKLLVTLIPFLTLIISLTSLIILSEYISNPIDYAWTTRQFVLGMFMFAALTIVPRLLQFRFSFINGFPRANVKLSHHTSELQESHEFKFRSLSLCTGCFGSFLGIMISEIIFLGYLLTIFSFDETIMIIFFVVGIFSVIIAYSRYLVELPPLFRLFQHSLLFIGVSFTLISCDHFFNSALVMILLLPSWLSFLGARVFLSKLDHQ